MIRFLFTYAAGMMTAIVLTISGNASAGEVIRDHPVVHGVIAPATGRACPEEDSINCFWNAGRAGNGKGHSFYAVRVGHRVCTIYWDRAYNRTHGWCQHL